MNSPGDYATQNFHTLHDTTPAVAEINAIAPFSVSVLPVKQGKRVAAIKVGWWPKDSEALHEASKELERSKVGRRARLAGAVEYVAAPAPSTNRLTRQGGSLLDFDE